MAENEPTNHHYVPQFLLNRWAMKDQKGQMKLPVHYWHRWQNRPAFYWAGSTAVCSSEGLFSLSSNASDRAEIERFYQKVDDRGRNALAKIASQQSLSINERYDICSFLASLVNRRPSVVAALRSMGTGILRKTLDKPELRNLMRTEGIDEDPVAYFEARNGNLEDHALSILKSLTHSHRLRKTLTAIPWTVVSFDGSEELILGDVPLIRFGDLTDPFHMWLLALSPHQMLIIGAQPRVAKALIRLHNTASAESAQTKVLLRADVTPPWLAKRLRARFLAGPTNTRFPSVERQYKSLGIG